MLPEILKNLSIKISQYFLEFLESDFKRQQAPRRRVVLQTDNGFKAGMRIAPYTKLQSVIWEVLDKPINSELKFPFKPKIYFRQLSNSLKLVIKEQVETLSPNSIEEIKAELLKQSNLTLGDSLSSPEEWIESLHLVLMNEISKHLVRPILSLIDEALSKQSYSQIDSVFNAEIDLVQRIANPLVEVLTEVLARYSATRKINELESVCNDRLNIDIIKASLIDYFEMFASSDAYLEFRDIETYASTAEGMQLYLYVGTIKYGSITYPLFYIPIETEYEDSIKGFKLELSSHIFANKRAMDFVLQELGERQSRQWLSPIEERITYVEPEQSIISVLNPLIAKIQSSFGLLDGFELSGGAVQQLADTNVTINNALHICAFEKSDEALLNDYEEMLSQARNNEAGVVELFQGIVGGILIDNPTSIEATIDKQWDEMSVENRVVPDSPIPLNEEQVKIINAISHESGKFIVVEGPPGTGKSHTIVAIAADCAFKNKSCLILSDKKEALEVVQKKLSKTMNEVRGDSEFPNPLLRLGTEQANFRKLTSSQVLTQVQAHSKATRASHTKIGDERDSKRASLKANILQTISSFGGLNTKEIAEVQRTERLLNEIAIKDLSKVLDDLHDVNLVLNMNFEDEASLKLHLQEIFDDAKSNPNFEANVLKMEFRNRAFVSTVYQKFNRESAQFCSALSLDGVEMLSKLLAEFRGIKMPLFGYLFRGAEIARINSEIQKSATFVKQINIKKDVTLIENLLNEARYLISWIEEFGEPLVSFKTSFNHIRKKHTQAPVFNDLYKLFNALQLSGYEHINDIYITPSNSLKFADTWVYSMKYYVGIQKIKSYFASAPHYDFVGLKTEIEKLNTTLMNSEVDNRLINFMQNSKADAKILAKLIKDKQKFPEDKFGSVKHAFPIIVASIREFGEFMPLKSDLFDVLIIDEASQVSVAQAFPALLRAKKVVVMGDSKQFSNTKSSNASNALNSKYRSDLNAYFKREVSTDTAMLERLTYFDVKRSILEFCQMSSNYSIMLRKHFRSYQELISYCSKTFYGGQLQAIKIRGVPLSDVIEFTVIEDNIVSTRSTNQSEAEFILKKCIELLEEDKPPSVGIITPFNEQQTLISKMFSNHALYQLFKEKLQIKIMTFDSCQGEERNIIFYSLVATKVSDTLNYIFPVNLEDAQELVEQKLKIQRLNVGFSRAQEMIWFVISKPVNEFKGSIGQALKHFELTLNTVKASSKDTDPLSPMESKVLNWIYSGEFYQVNEEQLEVLPQFPIGDYLKQLDPTYKHPSYKVDFLLTFTNEKGIVHIVIEYDGFEYHFKKDKEVDEGNHEQYLTDSDIERQLTLESYGYKFIRINRFNLGKEPVRTLSDRLNKLVNMHFQDSINEVVKNLQFQATSLINKSAKQCPQCNQIKEHKDYFDKMLSDGHGSYGRICIQCKNSSHYSPHRKRKWR